MIKQINTREALTFDDVLLVPRMSEISPTDVETKTMLTRDISLHIPLLSAAMDTVTGGDMAIAMAHAGGLGIIHRNMPTGRQVEEVRRVKRYEAGMVTNPITVTAETSLAEAIDLMKNYSISGLPVVDGASRKLVGILTNRDVRFVQDMEMPVKALMTHENLITVREDVTKEQAKELLHQYRIEKLLVVDAEEKCVGMITVKDIEQAVNHPYATRDDKGRLRAGAAVGVGRDGYDRAAALIDAEVDLIIVDTAHGHSRNVIDTVRKIRQLGGSKPVQVIAGNVATPDGARSLIDAGVDGIKIGVGPGSICTTRIVAGVGVPQLTAVMDTAEACSALNIPVIADGGIKHSGDLTKALAAGASCAMIGSLLAGTDEAPGDVIYFQGRSYKSYRGMGSLGAMKEGARDRYKQDHINDASKLVPEGVEGRVPYKGSVDAVLNQLIGGLKSGMGYLGANSLLSLQNNAEFLKISQGAIRESHVHGVQITREAPNYSQDR